MAKSKSGKAGAKQQANKVVKKFEKARARRTRCLLMNEDEGKPCGKPAIRGHSVPKNVLSEIQSPAQEGAKVLLPTDTHADKFMRLLVKRNLDDHELKCAEVPISRALTGRFSCADHDNRIFDNVDEITPDSEFDDPEYQFLMAYRVALHTFSEIIGVCRALQIVGHGNDIAARYFKKRLRSGKQLLPVFINKREGLLTLLAKVERFVSRLREYHSEGQHENLTTCLLDLDLKRVKYPMNFAASMLTYVGEREEIPLMITVAPFGDCMHKALVTSPDQGAAQRMSEKIKHLESDSLPLLSDGADGMFEGGHVCVKIADYENVPEAKRDEIIRSNLIPWIRDIRDYAVMGNSKRGRHWMRR